VDGFAAAGRSSGSLSSMGRDQGSICSDRERDSRFLDRSGSEVEEDAAMSGWQSAAGVAESHSRGSRNASHCLAVGHHGEDTRPHL
jgi:hypothetical protein